MTSKFECRACGSKNYELILDMGNVPLANAFVNNNKETTDKTLWPLSLVMCSSIDCRLLQLGQDVPREKLFSDTDYLWVTSTSAGAKKHADWLSQRLWEKFGDRNKGQHSL